MGSSATAAAGRQPEDASDLDRLSRLPRLYERDRAVAGDRRGAGLAGMVGHEAKRPVAVEGHCAVSSANVFSGATSTSSS